MNRQEIREECEFRFRDLNKDIYTDAEWNKYINIALRDFNNAFDWPWKHTVSASSMTYIAGLEGSVLPNPNNINEVLSVFNETDDWIMRPLRNYEQARQMFPDLSQRGRPLYYILTNNTLRLFPVPDGTTVVTVETRSPPIDLTTDVDIPTMPTNYHSTIVEGALYRAYLDDGNADQANLHKAEFGEGINRAMIDTMGGQHGRNTVLTDDWWS